MLTSSIYVFKTQSNNFDLLNNGGANYQSSQSRKISAGKQSSSMPTGQSSGEQPRTIHDQHIHVLIKKIKHAVEAGYLDKSFLNQTLAAPRMVMLNDFINLTEVSNNGLICFKIYFINFLS